MKQTFQHKATRITAVLWTGENLDEVREIYPGIGAEYMQDKGMYPGSWIFSPEKGQVRSASQAYFEAEFFPVPEGTPERPKLIPGYAAGYYGDTAEVYMNYLEAQLRELDLRNQILVHQVLDARERALSDEGD